MNKIKVTIVLLCLIMNVSFLPVNCFTVKAASYKCDLKANINYIMVSWPQKKKAVEYGLYKAEGKNNRYKRIKTIKGNTTYQDTIDYDDEYTYVADNNSHKYDMCFTHYSEDGTKWKRIPQKGYVLKGEKTIYLKGEIYSENKTILYGGSDYMGGLHV